MTKKNFFENLPTELYALTSAYDEMTAECAVDCLREVMLKLRDTHSLAFDQLIDVCAVDYLHYGLSDWETSSASEHGFSRGVELQPVKIMWDKSRFAVVYHLLSTRYNQRLRIKVYVEDASLIVPSVHDIWRSAEWYEREAYDLFGILFSDHPDLRIILTDYGFIGHPLRKDFPLSGHVEMRYDAKLQQVIYEPVDLEPRILEPKVIRHVHRSSDRQETVS